MSMVMPVRHLPESSSGPPLFPASTHVQTMAILHTRVSQGSRKDQAADRVDSCKHTSANTGHSCRLTGIQVRMMSA